jgi:hypothetical protein
MLLFDDPSRAGPGGAAVMRTDGERTLQEVRAQIERVRRGLLASVEQQSEVADELTQIVPDEVRNRILANIDAIHARLVAYGRKLKRR